MPDDVSLSSHLGRRSNAWAWRIHTSRRKIKQQRLCSNCASETQLSLLVPGSWKNPQAPSCSPYVFQELFGLNKRCDLGLTTVIQQTPAPTDDLACRLSVAALGAYLQLFKAIAEGCHLMVPVATHQFT